MLNSRVCETLIPPVAGILKLTSSVVPYLKDSVNDTENVFSVDDFNEIECSSLENHKNYDWRIMLKFEGKKEMKAFLHFLKDFRRKATLQMVIKRNNKET